MQGLEQPLPCSAAELPQAVARPMKLRWQTGALERPRSTSCLVCSRDCGWRALRYSAGPRLTKRLWLLVAAAAAAAAAAVAEIWPETVVRLLQQLLRLVFVPAFVAVKEGLSLAPCAGSCQNLPVIVWWCPKRGKRSSGLLLEQKQPAVVVKAIPELVLQLQHPVVGPVVWPLLRGMRVTPKLWNSGTAWCCSSLCPQLQGLDYCWQQLESPKLEFVAVAGCRVAFAAAAVTAVTAAVTVVVENGSQQGPLSMVHHKTSAVAGLLPHVATVVA